MTLPPRSLTDAERVAWLQLIRTDRIGPITFQQLMARFSFNADEVLQALPSLKGAASKTTPFSKSAAEDELAKANHAGARVIASCEPEYPEALAQIPDAPPVITVKGDVNAFLNPSIAMVGARNASAAGRRMARDIATDLCENGYVVVSGMARGIDAEAHAATLKTGGKTIAVLAGGVDSIYPPEHQKLYSDIIENGAIISERPLGYIAKGRDFPKRNRIIGGLTLGVLVVEAARRSGSLVSARMALEQGREVMAVPGSPLDERTAGSNGLIKQGAWLIETADDVISALEGMTGSPRRVQDSLPRYGLEPASATQTSEEDLSRLRVVLSSTPVSLEDLASAAGLTLAKTRAAITELELLGEADSLVGGTAALRMD